MAIHSMYLFQVIILFPLFQNICANYYIPDIELLFYYEGGFFASIPYNTLVNDFEIKVTKANNEFDYISGHGKINPTRDCLIYENRTFRVKEGDIINYWILVQVEETYGYFKEYKNISVENLYERKKVQTGCTKPKQHTKNCVTGPSITMVNGEENGYCVNEIIFEDTFSTSQIDDSKWNVECVFPDSEMDDELSYYDKDTVKIIGGNLVVAPVLVPEGKKFISIDLGERCTHTNKTFCSIIAQKNSDRVSIIKSGRINTQNVISFKYGKVLIKAKFPISEYMYPAIYLLPKYIDENSKMIRLALARGNKELKDVQGKEIGNKILNGGIRTINKRQKQICYNFIKKNDKSWGNEFHTYGFLWKKEYMEFTVDNEVYGTITSKDFSGKCGPIIDEELYLSIGVALGGTVEFSNSETWFRNYSQQTKPRSFFENKQKEENKWNDILTMYSTLEVQSVKITAV